MKIAVIGCGNMGSGIAKQLAEEHELFLSDRSEKKAMELASALNCTEPDPGEAVKAAEIILLAVKPQNLSQAAKQIKKDIKTKQLVVSILAGTPISILKQHLGPIPILRMMPNLAVVYGQGMIGMVETPEITPRIKKSAEKLCGPLGSADWLTEDKLDAFAALTASGPAFVLVLIEAMVEAAVAMGFSARDGIDFVLEMLTGTIVMLKESGNHPAERRLRITSPGGMTSAGLRKWKTPRSADQSSMPSWPPISARTNGPRALIKKNSPTGTETQRGERSLLGKKY